MCRINKILAILPIFIVTAFFLITSSYCSDEKTRSDTFPDVRLPIYQNAQSIRQGFAASLGCKYVSYKIPVRFPALKIIRFYDKELNNMGFQQYSEDGYGTRMWEHFNYKSGSWEPTEHVPARFIATWADEKKEKRIILDLFYKYDTRNKQWKETLFVECKVCHFFVFGEE